MKRQRRRKIAAFVFALLVVAVAFLGGMESERKVLRVKTPLSAQVQYLTGRQTGQPTEVKFGVFWEAWSVVDNYFYKSSDSDKQKRVDGAIEGMLLSTGDRYAAYLPKDENKLYTDDLSGSFSGIGAELSSINGYPTIVAPLSGSPAEKAGLLAKDIITKVDGVDTTNESFAHAINRIRGVIGTTVKLTIVRVGSNEPLEIAVVRAEVTLPNVTHSVVTGDHGLYGYIKIDQFLEDTASQVASAITDLQAKQVRGLVIDLRNNPGGLLSSSVDIVSLLVDPDVKTDLHRVVVSQKDRDSQVITYKVTSKPLETHLPLTLLMNEGSASASEITAGALTDYGRATLVGTTSFGKGSVQELKNLSDGSSVKITVAHWLTPANHEIDGVGIAPTHVVALHADEKVTAGDVGQDRQLREALNLLQ